MAVYFIRAGDDGPVKIGTADDVPGRLRELQCGNHEPLAIIRTVSGDALMERAFHRHFAPHLIRGEWFQFDPQMMTVDVEPLTPKSVKLVASLDKFLTETKTTKKALADALGVTEEAVRLWTTGQRKPRQEQLDALHEHTGGRVSANDFWHTAAE